MAFSTLHRALYVLCIIRGLVVRDVLMAFRIFGLYSGVLTSIPYLGLCLYLLQDAKNGAEIKAVDAYCWLHSTVHLDTSLLRKLNTMPQIRSPCIGLTSPAAGLEPSGTPMETLYYQWVPFFLLFQVGSNGGPFCALQKCGA